MTGNSMTETEGAARLDQLLEPSLQLLSRWAGLSPVDVGLGEDAQDQEGIVQLVDVPNSRPGVVLLLLDDTGVKRTQLPGVLGKGPA